MRKTKGVIESKQYQESLAKLKKEIKSLKSGLTKSKKLSTLQAAALHERASKIRELYEKVFNYEKEIECLLAANQELIKAVIVYSDISDVVKTIIDKEVSTDFAKQQMSKYIQHRSRAI